MSSETELATATVDGESAPPQEQDQETKHHLSGFRLYLLALSLSISVLLVALVC